MRKLAASLLVLLCLLTALAGCGGKSAGTWQENYDLGVKYLSAGNYEEAIIAFTAAIQIDPKQVGALTGRAQAYILSGETAETLSAALADYEAALALDDTLAEGWLGLADVYIRQGNFEKALDILRQAAEKVSGNDEISAKLAELEGGNVTDSSGKTRRTSGFDGSGVLIWYRDYTYGANGKQSGVTAYSADGTLLNHVDIAYDADGRPMNGYSYTPSTGMINLMEYDYDAAGNRSTTIRYDDDNTTVLSRNVISYENGVPMTETTYNAAGEIQDRWENEYDAQGKRIKRANFTPDGRLNYYQTWEYDEHGKQTVYRSFNADGSLQWYHINRYDAQGNSIGADRYDGEGNLTGSTVNS